MNDLHVFIRVNWSKGLNGEVVRNFSRKGGLVGWGE